MAIRLKVRPSDLKTFVTGALLASTLSASNAYALTMPWEGPFRQVLDSLQGTTAQILVVAGVVITALTFIWGGGEGPFRAGVRVVAGGATAIGASALASQLFGF